MNFISIEFALFLIIVFTLYWSMRSCSLTFQNTFMLSASYFFYGWWDWRFLILIFGSTCIDFITAIKINKSVSPSSRKAWLMISLSSNLGLLLFFKYFNFFVQSWIDAWQQLGISMHPLSIKIILPVGISFYTFQTLSYSIDVYRKKITPTKDFISFAAFVAFFPQLVAGPIERAKNLLPQFLTTRKFNYDLAMEGAVQILWGLFKKTVISNNCAPYVNTIFQNHANLPGNALLLGAIMFSFQIYGDFSGYSDIAIGTSKLFGFRLMTNFKYPYFSRNIPDFWRRWHISLSSWFRDYVYIPLGGSKTSTYKIIRNIFIVFLVSGLWHGANWTYLAWGGIHALLFLPFLLSRKNRRYKLSNTMGLFPNPLIVLRIITTFLLVSLSWIYFRSENISQAHDIFLRIFSPNTYSLHWGIKPFNSYLLICFVFFLFCEWIGKNNTIPIKTKSSFLNFCMYLGVAYITLICSYKGNIEFIYFQF
ncbi:MAG: MBOAT family protein [Fibrobacteria bacterium]|nr:MBOAT family protein [Fibrobacteria bacterium]